eukprot:COSAG01_NODE_22227_length_865_cov_15.737598_1_plen_185_part_01
MPETAADERTTTVSRNLPELVMRAHLSSTDRARCLRAAVSSIPSVQRMIRSLRMMEDAMLTRRGKHKYNMLDDLIRVCKAEPIPLQQLEDILKAFPDACDALVDKVAVELKTGGTGHTTALHEICKNQTLTIKALEVALRHLNTRELLHTLGDNENYETPFASLCNNEKINKGLLRVASGGDVEK